ILCHAAIGLSQDTATSSWLSQGDPQRAIAPAADAFLEPLHGRIRFLTCEYSGSQLTATHAFEDDKLVSGERVWRSTIDVRPAGDDQGALDMVVTFSLDRGTEASAGVAVAFDFSDWSTDNYVMIPAAVYNANRCKIVPREYAAGLDRQYLYGKDLPLMSCPIPQLAFEPGEQSRLELTSCNAATPAMCFYNRGTRRAFILLTEQKTQLGDNGLIIEETADRRTATFVVSAPGVRERRPLFVGFEESPDRGAKMTAGDAVRLRMRLYSFETPDIPGLLEKFMAVRKAVSGPNRPRNLIPFSQVARWMTDRIDSRWHEGFAHQFYCCENARWISFGWVGGLMNTFPMLALGDEMHLDRATRTFDFAIPRAQGQSGYFYGALNHDGKCFGREGYDESPEIVLARKNADVLYWMVKQFMLLRAQGRQDAVKPAWESSIKRVADAFVGTWRKHGTWGRMVNNATGDVAEYNTCGGVMAVGALALASVYYEDPEYLQVAKEAAESYFQNPFVEQGQTTGGCADILQNADSETAAGFMTALMTLYEVTGEAKWLEKSRNLANLVSTWTTSYDYELPPQTELAKLGAKLTGAYWASTQNKHAAPGICTSSGDALLKIYRATGDRRYADLLNDIVHAHAESIRPGGYTNERLTYCDADAGSVGNRGEHVTGWNELNGFLIALEIPGIYVRTDTDELYVFDHVEASAISRNAEGVTLRITNKTPYGADVAILAESVEQARIPLGCTSFLAWPKATIEPGESKMVLVAPDGHVKPK
ncbi:MAG: hypothetical protein ACM3VT_07085, partial [Solirubrobacterales bacterium]